MDFVKSNTSPTVHNNSELVSLKNLGVHYTWSRDFNAFKVKNIEWGGVCTKIILTIQRTNLVQTLS
jgi:hypothetical protein